MGSRLYIIFNGLIYLAGLLEVFSHSVIGILEVYSVVLLGYLDCFVPFPTGLVQLAEQVVPSTLLIKLFGVIYHV